MRKVWGSLLELARFVWETREACRRPGDAPGEDRKKREFSAARGEARVSSRSSMADQNHGWSLGGGKEGEERPLRKCVVTHFEARGPREPLEAWRCAAGGAAGAL